MLWWTGPSSEPSDLGRHLEAHGFLHAETVPGMAVDLNMLNEAADQPPGLRVEEVTDEAALRIWSKSCVEGFEMPDFSQEFTEACLASGFGPDTPMRLFQTWMDDEAVATALVFFGAGVAGIYNVATVPNARGRGAGTAVTLAPMVEARAEGYRVAILHASPMGYPVYRKLGFREYCTVHHYVWPDSD
jgi:GNAT superfamily N-acetyltransferase